MQINKLIKSTIWAVFIVSTVNAENWWPAQKKPQKIAIIEKCSDFSEENLVQSLSGLAAQAVNNDVSDELTWINTDNEEYNAIFETTVRKLYITDIHTIDIWQLLSKYQNSGIVKGYILYDSNDNPDKDSEHSLNIATCMSGILQGVLVDTAIQNRADKLGLKMLYDARNKKLSDIFEKYKDQFNRNLAFSGNPRLSDLRDYAIAHKCITFYGTNEPVPQIMEWLMPPAPILGWGKGNESEHVGPASKWGHFETASDKCMNLPLISAAEDCFKNVKVKSIKPWEIDFNKKGDFVSFLYSDGDNVQWMMGGFVHNDELWASPLHGRFPMSWSICSAQLAQISPQTLAFLSASQPQQTSLVEFSGGYYYPDLFAKNRPDRKHLLEVHAKNISDQLKKTGVNVLCFICMDINSEDTKQACEIFVREIEGLTGIIAIQYYPYDGGNGKVFWYKNKAGKDIPVVSAKYTTWQGAKWERGGDIEKIASLINNHTDESQKCSFNVVINHAWSKYNIDGKPTRGLAAVNNLYKNIRNNAEVVNIEELLWRLRMQKNPQQTSKQIMDAQQKMLKRDIYVVNIGKFSKAEQIMITTLQGLAANDPYEVLWTGTGGMSALLLDEYRRNGNKIVYLDSPWDALNQFRDKINGAILYDSENQSLNAATSLCGPFNSIAVDKSLLTHIKNINIPVIKDVTNYSEEKILDEYHELFNKEVAVEQTQEKYIYLRDFAVANNSFTYFDHGNDFLKELAQDISEKLIIYGWGTEEFSWIKNLSMHNFAAAPADWALNLSVMQSMKQPITERPVVKNPKPAEDGQRIIAFVMSDGDNIQWMSGEFATSKGFWANRNRGKFNMTWEVAPLMADMASGAMNYLYSTTSKGKFTDDFVAGSSGLAYCFPSHRTDIKDYAEKTAKALQKSRLGIASILDSNGDLSIAKEFLERPEILGVIYKDFDKYNKYQGQIYWHNGKPCVSYKYVLWEGREENSPQGVARSISQMPTCPDKDPNSYALINVHAWSFGNTAGPVQNIERPLGDIGGPMEAVYETLKLLPPGTRIVTAQELFTLLRNNFGEPVK